MTTIKGRNSVAICIVVVVHYQSTVVWQTVEVCSKRKVRSSRNLLATLISIMIIGPISIIYPSLSASAIHVSQQAKPIEQT